MNFRDSIKRYFGPSNVIPYNTYSILPGIINTFPTTEVSNIYLDICSRAISNTVANIPLNIYILNDKGFKEVVTNDWRYSLLHHRPNDYMNRYKFGNALEYTKQRYGESFAVIHKFKSPKNIITGSFEPLHPSLLTRRYFDDSGLLKFEFTTSKGIKIYDANDVLHFMRDSQDGVNPIRPYDILYEEIKRIYLANKTITNYYKNDGKGTRYIKTTGIGTKGEIAQIDSGLNKFREEMGGASYDTNNKRVEGNVDKTISYPRAPGNSEIGEVANVQNDALYLATIEKAALNIAAEYGIPAHYLNIMQAQKNNNVQTMQLDFKSTTIAHTLNQNRQEWETKLLTTEEIDKGMSIEYNVNAILELSSEERMAQYASLQKTARISANEVRKIEGMEWIEGGDVHPIFDQMTSLEKLDSGPSTDVPTTLT